MERIVHRHLNKSVSGLGWYQNFKKIKFGFSVNELHICLFFLACFLQWVLLTCRSRFDKRRASNPLSSAVWETRGSLFIYAQYLLTNLAMRAFWPEFHIDFEEFSLKPKNSYAFATLLSGIWFQKRATWLSFGEACENSINIGLILFFKAYTSTPPILRSKLEALSLKLRPESNHSPDSKSNVFDPGCAFP